MMSTWVGAGQKFDFFVWKSWFLCNSKYFSQNIMMPSCWYYFCIVYIFHFYQIIMVSLFLAWNDQYFIMFNVFEITNFPFKTKYNNTLVYSVNNNYLFWGETRKKIVETVLWLNLLSIYKYSAKTR